MRYDRTEKVTDRPSGIMAVPLVTFSVRLWLARLLLSNIYNLSFDKTHYLWNNEKKINPRSCLPATLPSTHFNPPFQSFHHTTHSHYYLQSPILKSCHLFNCLPAHIRLGCPSYPEFRTTRLRFEPHHKNHCSSHIFIKQQLSQPGRSPPLNPFLFHSSTPWAFLSLAHSRSLSLSLSLSPPSLISSLEISPS